MTKCHFNKKSIHLWSCKKWPFFGFSFPCINNITPTSLNKNLKSKQIVGNVTHNCCNITPIIIQGFLFWRRNIESTVTQYVNHTLFFEKDSYDLEEVIIRKLSDLKLDETVDF